MGRIGTLLIFILSLFFSSLNAQELLVHGTTPDLYLIHKVQRGETWYALSRTYNIPPKDISAFNNRTLESGLQVGQEIKIPLRSVNFSQNEIKAADEVFVPVYHIIQPREWLYRISQNHNKVPVETLERWNNITANDAVAGTRLIVGFLKVKSNQSSLASKATGIPNALASNAGRSANQPSRPAEPQNKEPEPPVTLKEAPRSNAPIEGPKKESAPASAEKTPPVVTSNPPASAPAQPIPEGGYFRNQFTSSGNKTSGIAGVFKSTSGWKDGKYYALMNGVPVGTIIRVNFPSTNRTIYAKVLGELPDMKESEGLTLRLSDAAASELGGGYQKFTVEIRY